MEEEGKEYDDRIRKSRQWNIPITTLPEEVYSFETHVYEDDQVIVIILTKLDDPDLIYDFIIFLYKLILLKFHYFNNGKI